MVLCEAYGQKITTGQHRSALLAPRPVYPTLNPRHPPQPQAPAGQQAVAGRRALEVAAAALLLRRSSVAQQQPSKGAVVGVISRQDRGAVNYDLAHEREVCDTDRVGDGDDATATATATAAADLSSGARGCGTGRVATAVAPRPQRRHFPLEAAFSSSGEEEEEEEEEEEWKGEWGGGVRQLYSNIGKSAPDDSSSDDDDGVAPGEVREGDLYFEDRATAVDHDDDDNDDDGVGKAGGFVRFVPLNDTASAGGAAAGGGSSHQCALDPIGTELLTNYDNEDFAVQAHSYASLNLSCASGRQRGDGLALPLGDVVSASVVPAPPGTAPPSYDAHGVSFRTFVAGGAKVERQGQRQCRFARSRRLQSVAGLSQSTDASAALYLAEDRKPPKPKRRRRRKPQQQAEEEEEEDDNGEEEEEEDDEQQQQQQQQEEEEGAKEREKRERVFEAEQGKKWEEEDDDDNKEQSKGQEQPQPQQQQQIQLQLYAESDEQELECELEQLEQQCAEALQRSQLLHELQQAQERRRNKTGL